MELQKEDIRKELYQFGCGYMLDEYMELFNKIGKIYHKKQLNIPVVVVNEANWCEKCSKPIRMENNTLQLLCECEISEVQLLKNNCTLNRQTCGKGSGCKYPHCHL